MTCEAARSWRGEPAFGEIWGPASGVVRLRRAAVGMHSANGEAAVRGGLGAFWAQTRERKPHAAPISQPGV